MLVHKYCPPSPFIWFLLQQAVKRLRQVLKSYTAVILHNKIWHLFVLKVVAFYRSFK